MAAVLAARLGDDVGSHSGALFGLCKGLLTGLVIGVAMGAMVAATVATAGLAGPVLAGVAIAAGAGTIGLMGTLGRTEMEKGQKERSGSPCSEIKKASPNVFVETRPAARKTDPVNHGDGHLTQGSATVFANGLPFSRY